MQPSDISQPAAASIDAWTAQGKVDRFWAGDPTLWSDDPATPELANRLGWIDLHDTMRPALARIGEVAAEVKADSDHVVLCGMGGSSLAPEVFAAVFGALVGYPELIVLDSTHPAAVLRVREQINPERTTFVISSKSGTTLETLSFFRYFYAETGGVGSRFIAVTDPGSKLAELGAARGFRAIFEADPNVGGRFSALTHFGLVPAALVGVDVARLLDAAAELASGASHDAGDDPAAALGIALGEASERGIDKLTVVTSASLAAFPAWMEQLVAESLGKEGKGIVPVADEPIGEPSEYGADRVILSYRLKGERAPGVDGLREAGIPVVEIELKDKAAVGAEMLRAEAMTAVAGVVMGVHPFDQPNVEAAKNFARQAMDGDLDLGGVVTTPIVDAAAVFTDMIETMPAGDYFGVHAYLPADSELWEAITELRLAVRKRTKVATTAGWGPRFLHSTGQLHKGGGTGTFLQLINTPAPDLAVPETDVTFGEIIAAQSAGDYSALLEAGRRLLRVDVGSDPVSFVNQLTSAIS